MDCSHLGVNSLGKDVVVGENAEFDGSWGPACIANGLLTFNEDEDEHIQIEPLSNTQLYMTYACQTFMAELRSDGKLHWSDGDVWSRKFVVVFKVDFDNGTYISMQNPESVIMRAVRLLEREFGHPLPARLRSIVEGIVPSRSTPSKQNLWCLLSTMRHLDEDCEDAIGHFVCKMSDVDKHWAMYIAPTSQSLGDITITQQGWYSASVMSRAGASLNEFLSVREVARTKHMNPCADEGGHLQRRLECERPAHHSGVIKFVDSVRKFGVIRSDAGRKHIVLQDDIHFDMVDGHELLSFENTLHGGLFSVEITQIRGVPVIFDLQENIHKGIRKPFKAVNVKVKL